MSQASTAGGESVFAVARSSQLAHSSTERASLPAVRPQPGIPSTGEDDFLPGRWALNIHVLPQNFHTTNMQLLSEGHKSWHDFAKTELPSEGRPDENTRSCLFLLSFTQSIGRLGSLLLSTQTIGIWVSPNFAYFRWSSSSSSKSVKVCACIVVDSSHFIYGNCKYEVGDSHSRMFTTFKRTS